MRRRVLTVSKLILLALFLWVLTGISQDFQIRARVDLVVVPVTVKGAGDRLITGLRKDDFIILEDGKKQTITNFTVDPVPLSAVIIVDAGLPPSSLEKVQQTFSALAASFGESDEVALYRFDKFVTKVLDFSQDSAMLETSMKTMRDMNGREQFSAIPRDPFSTSGPVINGAEVVPPDQSVPKATVSNVLSDAIFAAASDLAKRDHDRRKIVLVISDGRDAGSVHTSDETLTSLLQSSIQLYAVTVGEDYLSKKSSVMRALTKATGGDAFYVKSTQSIEKSYSAATEEARNQYVLGYISMNVPKTADPVFRNIEVKLATARGETLHRNGYYQYP
jgi:VWFA-related protein